jgi:hypothetical protein
MKLRFALFSALCVVSGLSANAVQANDNFVLRGKVVTADQYRMLINDCNMRKSFFKDSSETCETKSESSSSASSSASAPSTSTTSNPDFGVRD